MSLLFFFAKRFIAGETIEEMLRVAKLLKGQGFATTVDNLGEHVGNIDESKQAVDLYLNILRALKKHNLDINVSVKPTQIGLEISPDLCFENLKIIAQEAHGLGGFVRVDAEGSDTTSSTVDVIKEVRDLGLPVGAVIQSMLRRSATDLVSFLESGIKIRLCKGAYKEPVDIAYQDKKEVDRQYVALMKRLLTSGIHHGIATHDDKIIEETKKFAKQCGIAKDRFEFQMLLGIRPKFQQKLVNDGWKVRVYVPFGKSWLPYTYRRLRERKENIWFVAKNFFRQ